MLGGISGNAIARLVIPDYISKGISATRALMDFRAVGGVIRTQTWHNWYREFSGLMKYQYQMERLRPDTPVPEAWVERVLLKRPYFYRSFFEVQYKDLKTGQTETKWISMYTDTFLTAEGWIEEFELDRQRADYRSGHVIMSYELKGVQKSTLAP